VEADCTHLGFLQGFLVALAHLRSVERVAGLGMAEDQIVVVAVCGALQVGFELGEDALGHPG
jgi:hypothetical protein